MKNRHWTERLSEHLDGELSAAEARQCEAHLAECSDCAGTLEELRAVVAQASLLPDVPPARDLWPDIEGRLREGMDGAVPAGEGSLGPAAAPFGSGSRRRRVTMTMPQLMAAAITLIVFSAGSAWLVLGGGAGPSPSVAAVPAGAPAGGPGVRNTPEVVLTAAYEDAVSQLELEFEERRGALDPETIRVVEQNLAIIDSAIVEAANALAEDPSSAFLNTHLASAMRQKVDLLRRVTAIGRTES